MNTIEEEAGEDAIQETVEIDLDDEPEHLDILLDSHGLDKSMVDAPPIPKPNEIQDAKVSPIKIDLGDDDFNEQDHPGAALREVAKTPVHKPESNLAPKE